jgi:hypothetical protein
MPKKQQPVTKKRKVRKANEQTVRRQMDELTTLVFRVTDNDDYANGVAVMRGVYFAIAKLTELLRRSSDAREDLRSQMATNLRNWHFDALLDAAYFLQTEENYQRHHEHARQHELQGYARREPLVLAPQEERLIADLRRREPSVSDIAVKNFIYFIRDGARPERD